MFSPTNLSWQLGFKLRPSLNQRDGAYPELAQCHVQSESRQHISSFETYFYACNNDNEIKEAAMEKSWRLYIDISLSDRSNHSWVM